MAGDIFTLDADNNAAVRTVSVNAGAAETNSPVIFTTDADGNAAVRVVGSGGGDSHNQGYYATPEALREGVPTAEAGDWAIVGSTDTVWVWDVEGSDWVDTDTKGEVTPDMIIVKSLTMPTASTTPAGAVYQYIGTTNANYTHGYIYENVKTSTYTGTVSFEAATLSGTTVACSGDNFANFLTESGVSPLSVVSGTMTYDAAGSLWVLVGKNASDETVLSFQEYQEDYEDFGFTFTGAAQDGDVIAFTCTVEEASASYAWTRIDVQPIPEIPDPLPSQTGNAGKFLMTDGANASWGNALATNSSGKVPFSSSSPLSLQSTQSSTNAFLKVYSQNGTMIFLNESVWNSSYSYSVSTYNGFSQVAGFWLTASGIYAYKGAGSQSSTFDLGSSDHMFDTTFTKKLNNGSAIDVPNVAGEMAVKSVNTTVTLASADWSSNSQTVTVNGITTTGVVLVSPGPTDQSAYTGAGIICTAQAANSLTFTCTSVPSGDIVVNVAQL